VRSDGACWSPARRQGTQPSLAGVTIEPTSSLWRLLDAGCTLGGMRTLELTATEVGVHLPFRTYEDDPPKAIVRGLAILRHWQRATGKQQSGEMRRLTCAAITLAKLPSHTDVPVELLQEFAFFVRLSASLWQLRNVPAFAPIAATLISTNVPGRIAHDECVLFLAAKLRAAGLAVRPPTGGAVGMSDPDLVLPGAGVRNADVYIEVKEREPDAPRDSKALAKFLRRGVKECNRQIVGRGARGFAFLDLGVVKEFRIPKLRPIAKAALSRHPKLHGVMISATLLKNLMVPAGDFFEPRFQSHMFVSEYMYKGRYPLSLLTRVALHRAFDDPAKRTRRPG
jgi:hypothetical protein